MGLFWGSLRAKLLFLLLIFGMALLPIFLSSNHVLAAQVTLGWDANPEPDIAGYKVHYGTSSRNYSTHIDVGKATTYTVTNLQSVAYYFAVTAYNTSGQESGYSAEAVYNPSSCSYSISASSQSFPASGGTGSVTVTTSAGCTWTVINNASSWITVTSNSSATGNGTVNYSAAANPGTTSRTGTLIIGGKTFTVTQSAGTATCTYSISPTSQPFNSSGGTGTINITAPGGCSWTASKNVSWITINTGSSGSGNGTTSYSVSANTTSTSRTGTITIAGKTLAVTQSGGTATCTYSISPTSQPFGLSGGTGAVSVTATSGCTWTASSSATWITITSGSSGSGNASTRYSVAANSGTSSRTGTLTIAGKTFTVTQAGGSAGSVVFAANAGGYQYSDSAGVTYKSDHSYLGGSGATIRSSISGTSDAPLYQTERYGDFIYAIPLANGNYTVTLKFAEIYWSSAGQRVFNVYIEGMKVISSLDIFAKVGKNRPYDLSFPVTVSDGKLDIKFQTIVDNAKVSAILVKTRLGGSVAVNALTQKKARR